MPGYFGRYYTRILLTDSWICIIGRSVTETSQFTAFAGHSQVVSGSLAQVATAVAAASEPALIFDDTTGAQVELDLRHGVEHALEEFRARTAPREVPPSRPGRGRPRLGVVAREVTLLPRHWDWLAGQPGGTSAALRRLVEDARRTTADADRQRRTGEAIYRVMSVLAGDLPGFEEAARALFAGDVKGLRARFQAWPSDVAAYLDDLVGRMNAPPE